MSITIGSESGERVTHILTEEERRYPKAQREREYYYKRSLLKQLSNSLQSSAGSAVIDLLETIAEERFTNPITAALDLRSRYSTKIIEGCEALLLIHEVREQVLEPSTDDRTGYKITVEGMLYDRTYDIMADGIVEFIVLRAYDGTCYVQDVELTGPALIAKRQSIETELQFHALAGRYEQWLICEPIRSGRLKMLQGMGTVDWTPKDAEQLMRYNAKFHDETVGKISRLTRVGLYEQFKENSLHSVLSYLLLADDASAHGTVAKLLITAQSVLSAISSAENRSQSTASHVRIANLSLCPTCSFTQCIHILTSLAAIIRIETVGALFRRHPASIGLNGPYNVMSAISLSSECDEMEASEAVIVILGDHEESMTLRQLRILMHRSSTGWRIHDCAWFDLAGNVGERWLQSEKQFPNLRTL